MEEYKVTLTVEERQALDRMVSSGKAAMTPNEQPACPICGGPLEIRYELPHTCARMESKQFRICWCRGCDLGLYLPRPSREELAEIYSTDYYTHHADGPEGVTNRRHLPPSSFFDRLRVHLAWRMDHGVPVDTELIAGLIQPPARLCDIGCGCGHLLSALKGKGYDVVGVEPDTRAREAAAVNGIDAHPGYAEAVPDQLRGMSFDAVTMLHTLEHCLDPMAAVREAVGLVRRGGYLIIEVPNNGSIVARSYGPSWFHADYGRHLNFFSRESLVALVRKVRLDVERIVFSEYVVHAMNERIAEEQSIWDWFVEDAGWEKLKGTVRNSKAVQWRMLVQTMFSPPARKYGIVGVVARKGVSAEAS